MTRWGAYTSRNMLSDYAAVLDKLVASSVHSRDTIGEHEVFRQAPREAQDLLMKALQFNPRHRISAEAFFCHPYLQGSTPQLMEWAGGAQQLATTLQENQSLQLGEDELVQAHIYEKLIAETCARVQQKRSGERR